jgi:hypothetical protein
VRERAALIMPRPPSDDDATMLEDLLMPAAGPVGGDEGRGDLELQPPPSPRAAAAIRTPARPRQLSAAEERDEALEVEAALRAVAMAEAREAAQLAAEAAGRERAALRAERHGGRLGPIARLQQLFDNGGWGGCSARQTIELLARQSSKRICALATCSLMIVFGCCLLSLHDPCRGVQCGKYGECQQPAPRGEEGGGVSFAGRRNGRGHCECYPGFTGQECEVGPCSGVDCSEDTHGQCEERKCIQGVPDGCPCSNPDSHDGRGCYDRIERGWQAMCTCKEGMVSNCSSHDSPREWDPSKRQHCACFDPSGSVLATEGGV